MRQGQAPFSGQVPSPGAALFFQEEFSSGDGRQPNHPLLGPGTQPLAPRWLPWVPEDAEAPTLWIDALQQRAYLLGQQPAGDPDFQWTGAVVLLPDMDAFPWTPDVPSLPDDDATCVLDWYFGGGVGLSHFNGFLPDSGSGSRAYTGMIVSEADLSVAGDNAFWALGIRHAVDSGGGDWESYAQFSQWSDSHELFAENTKQIQQTGALFRMVMSIQRAVAPGDPNLYTTFIEGYFSTDNGASWLSLGSYSLKGQTGPRVIGFGGTGYQSTEDGELNGAAGNYDSIRCFVRQLTGFAEDVSVIANVYGVLPDGGRNWP